jgi:hypothetical protein
VEVATVPGAQVVQWTSDLGIEVLRGCRHGIHFRLSFVPSGAGAAQAATGNYGGPASRAAPATDPRSAYPAAPEPPPIHLKAAFPPPLRDDGQPWERALEAPQVGAIIRWRDPRNTQQLRQPDTRARILFEQPDAELDPAPEQVPSAGAQLYEADGSPTGPYVQLPAGEVTATHAREFKFCWEGEPLPAGASFALSFEGFQPGRKSVDWVVFVEDCLHG